MVCSVLLSISNLLNTVLWKALYWWVRMFGRYCSSWPSQAEANKPSVCRSNQAIFNTSVFLGCFLGSSACFKHPHLCQHVHRPFTHCWLRQKLQRNVREWLENYLHEVWSLCLGPSSKRYGTMLFASCFGSQTLFDPVTWNPNGILQCLIIAARSSLRHSWPPTSQVLSAILRSGVARASCNSFVWQQQMPFPVQDR